MGVPFLLPKPYIVNEKDRDIGSLLRLSMTAISLTVDGSRLNSLIHRSPPRHLATHNIVGATDEAIGVPDDPFEMFAVGGVGTKPTFFGGRARLVLPLTCPT